MTKQCCGTCVRCGPFEGESRNPELYGFCNQLQENVVRDRNGGRCKLYLPHFADMLEFHDPDVGSIGDCWRACIATILGLPAEDVPHFEKLATQVGVEVSGTALTAAWLEDRGMTLAQVTDALLWTGDGFLCIASGTSPRDPDVRHCVVHDGVDVVHDPHPSRDGLVDFQLGNGKDYLMLIVKGAGGRVDGR